MRQMQKLLSAQEAAHLQGTRGLKKQLSALQSRVQRLAGKRNGNARHPHSTGSVPSEKLVEGSQALGQGLGLAPAW